MHPEPKRRAAGTVTHGVPEGFIPVSLKIDPDPAIAVGPIQFPKPERRNVLGEDQLVYSAPFRIAQDVTLAATPAVRDARARGWGNGHGQGHTEIPGLRRRDLLRAGQRPGDMDGRARAAREVVS